MPRRVARTLSTDDDKPEPPHLTLPAAQRRQLAARVQESVRGVVASMLSSGDTSKAVWQPKLRRGGVSYYVDTTTVRAGQTRFCCVSHTAAPVEEMLQLFRLTDTKSLLRNNRILYNNVLDARVLAVLERPTLQHPLRSTYVRYSCFQTPGPMANRDMCVAVATDVFTDPEDGATIGYCLWDSVGDEEPFSSVAHTPGLVPCVMFRSGFFFRRAAPGADAIDDPAAGQTKVVYILGMEPGGFAPGLTTRLLMVKFGANLLRLCAHFRRKRLDSSRFVLKSQWPSKSTARTCRRCSKSFTMLSVRVNCHACGQVVCKTCTSKETVELQAVGFVPMRICLGCLEVSGLPAPPTPLRSTIGTRRGRERLEMGDTLSSRSADYSTVETTLMSSSRSAVDWHDGDAEEWEMTPTGNVRHYRFEW